MSEGISFNTIGEANDYIKQKENEGFEAYYVKKDSKYKVYILGRILDKHANVRHVGNEELELPGNAEYDPVNEEIRLGRINVHGKVHEIGHLKLGHEIYTNDPKVVAREEIDAQIYSYQKNNKDINYKVALPALNHLADDFKLNPRRTVFIIKDVLKEKGIDLPHDIEEHWINEYLTQ